MQRRDTQRKVITYGTFDLFHYGHVNFLQRAKSLGDYLIVGLSTDDFNSKKNKKAVMYYSERFDVLQSCKYVDEIIPEKSWEQKIPDMTRYNCDVFVIGDDWRTKFDFLTDYGVFVMYLPRTEDISTTGIKNRIYALQ